MENLDLRTAVYEYIRDNMMVDVFTEKEIDYYDEYTVIKVSVRLRDPSSGDWIEVSDGSDSISGCR